MDNNAGTGISIGDCDPLIAGGRKAPPDRREISARWLLGTFLTGITSTVLLGVALSAALDGRELLATPPEIAYIQSTAPSQNDRKKAARLHPSPILTSNDTKRRLEVASVVQVGDKEVIRALPLMHIKAPLAANYGNVGDYPSFDPLAVFTPDGTTNTAGNMGIIYSARVESEISLRNSPFPMDSQVLDEATSLSAEEVERAVRESRTLLTEGDIQVAALHYVDPQRFGTNLATDALANFSVRVVQENVSAAPRTTQDEGLRSYAEDVLTVSANKPIERALSDAGHDGPSAKGMAEALGKLLNTNSLKAGATVFLGLEIEDDIPHIVRASLFQSKQHMVTIALDDRGQYVPSDQPDFGPELLAALDDKPQAVQARANMPRVYDGIYAAALSNGLNRAMTRQVVRLLASEVDMGSTASATDRIETFFTQPSETGASTEESELLYVGAMLGGKARAFYRFQLPDGTVDYFDKDGRNSRPFLLRNPVPTGRMTSQFGMRRHPVLGYSRLHSGTDWAAPRGTPILAAGDGVIEKAGWAGGYGRQTIIRHANGYKSSYNHQSGIAKGIAEGAQVRQGQVIGYVGSTGLSTGNHLHYELIVNNSKVDPMRVRMPDSKTLDGKQLKAFHDERTRIDALLQGSTLQAVPVAAAIN